MRQNSDQTQYLSALLALIRRSQQANGVAELGFIAVNETHTIAAYRQAALWLEETGVVSLSGVIAPEENAPYLHFLRHLFSNMKEHAGTEGAQIIRPENLGPEVLAEWKEWLPEQGVWLPLSAVGNEFEGGALLMVREEPWTPAEISLLNEWAGILSHAYALRRKNSGWLYFWRLTKTKLFTFSRDTPPTNAVERAWYRSIPRGIWLAIVLLAVLCMPVHLTVLAPASLVPLDAAIIRAPLDGVVDAVLVRPNQIVESAEPLFEFDRMNVKNRLEVAVNALETAQAEYRQKAQLSLIDSSNRKTLALLQGQIEEKSAELSYLKYLSELGVVVAPRRGVVLLDDPASWIGRPVVTGERVMVIADENAVEIEAWLSLADAITLEDGARITMYLNADPLNSIEATLRYVAYEPTERPGGHYAYRVRATLVGTSKQLRIGLKGTAKLRGDTVSFAYWVLRRPLAATRVWAGI